MLNEIKRIMISQCSPVLMGTKPSALFPLSSVHCFNCLSVLLPQGINVLTVRINESRPLVLLYDETLLEKTLSDTAVCRFLLGLGYPAAVFSMPHILRYLKTRFSNSDFPHEVGLFLGYPVEDVTGFVQHKGRNYKIRGYWKVYGDVEQAKRLFRQYDICRECMALNLEDMSCDHCEITVGVTEQSISVINSNGY